MPYHLDLYWLDIYILTINAYILNIHCLVLVCLTNSQNSKVCGCKMTKCGMTEWIIILSYCILFQFIVFSLYIYFEVIFFVTFLLSISELRSVLFFFCFFFTPTCFSIWILSHLIVQTFLFQNHNYFLKNRSKINKTVCLFVCLLKMSELHFTSIWLISTVLGRKYLTIKSKL